MSMHQIAPALHRPDIEAARSSKLPISQSVDYADAFRSIAAMDAHLLAAGVAQADINRMNANDKAGALAAKIRGGYVANSVLSGAGAPAAGLGADGDIYINTTTYVAGSAYRKVGGTWVVNPV